jgi:acyl-coenzyme A thioesterase PaaI-like protein
VGEIGEAVFRGDPASVTPKNALTPGSAVSQQHGFVHAGALAAIADSAAGYAALSLMPAGAGVLTTEFKINLLAPAAGSAFSQEGVSSRLVGH